MNALKRSRVSRAAALLAMTAIGNSCSTMVRADTKAGAPVPAMQFFALIEGGFSTFDAPSVVHAFDVAPPGAGPLVAGAFFDVGRGWFGRGELGATMTGRFGPIDAISVAASFRRGAAQAAGATSLGDAIALVYQSPSAPLTGAFLPGPANVSATQRFSLSDVQLRLKHVGSTKSGTSTTFEPFAAYLRHDVEATTSSNVTRGAEITGKIFGTQLALEHRGSLNDRVALRARASVGGYIADADGTFHIAFPLAPAANVADSVSRQVQGVRAGVEIGADIALTPGISLGLTAGIDHWSRMPSPRLSAAIIGGTPVAVGIDAKRFTDYFLGIRLTLVSGSR
jgi:hypothetical protein